MMAPLHRLKGKKRKIAGWVIALSVCGVVLAGSITAGVIWWYRSPALSTDPVALERDILALRAVRDTLQERVLRAEAQKELLERRPDGDVLLALPTPFVDALTQEIVGGWFREVDIHLRNITVRKAGDVRAKLGIFGRRNVGSYTLRLDLQDVRGRLAAGKPRLALAGDRVDIVLPVRLVGGAGRGVAAFEWDSKGLANGVCRDLAIKEPIDGAVEPGNYEARGFLRVAANDDGLMIEPRFPGLAMRLRVRPSKTSVARLQGLIESRGRLCRLAVDKANVEERILALLERGFEVKIPQRFFRPVRVPVAIEGTVPVAGTSLVLSASPDRVVVTPTAIWLSAQLTIKGAVR